MLKATCRAETEFSAPTSAEEVSAAMMQKEEGQATCFNDDHSKVLIYRDLLSKIQRVQIFTNIPQNSDFLQQVKLVEIIPISESGKTTNDISKIYRTNAHLSTKNKLKPRLILNRICYKFLKIVSFE